MKLTVTEFLNASLCLNTKNSIVNMKSRHSCSLIYTKKGALRFTQGESTIISSPENPIFIPKGASYTNYCLEEAESLMVNFLADTDITDILPLSPTPLAYTEPHYASLISLSDKALASPLTFAEGCRAVSEIYILLSLLTDTYQQRTDTEKLFDKAVGFILSELQNPDLSCALTASHLNISEVYLRRLFVRYSGIPTKRYIMKIRLEKAKQMLTDKSSIKNAALSVGYPDVYSFTRAYTTYFGFSPGKT